MPQIHSAGFALRYTTKSLGWMPLHDLEETSMGQLDREQMKEDLAHYLDEYEGAREELADLEKNISQPDAEVSRRKAALTSRVVLAAENVSRINHALARPRP